MNKNRQDKKNTADKVKKNVLLNDRELDQVTGGTKMKREYLFGSGGLPGAGVFGKVD